MIGFPGVSTFTDRHGKPRFRYRRKGAKAVYLPGLPGSPEFAQGYADAIAGLATKRTIGAERTIPGTLNALIVAFYKSAEWAQLEASTQRTYRGVYERFRREFGSFRVAQLTRERVLAIRDKRASTPAAANNLVRRLRTLMQFAVDRGLRADDPTANVKPLTIKSDGFHTWTEAEIATFEARWPVGTRERLAMDLLLYTAQRGSDVRLMGRQHVRGGRMVVKQLKTRAELEVSIHPRLHESLATVAERMTFVLTQFGEPYSPKGFGNWFSEACTRAGLPHCSAHGLRKAAARRLAEAGCSASQIAAVTGHKTLKEVERYVKAAEQRGLADAAMASIGGTQREQDLSNPSDRLANMPPKSLKGNGS